MRKTVMMLVVVFSVMVNLICMDQTTYAYVDSSKINIEGFQPGKALQDYKGYIDIKYSYTKGKFDVYDFGYMIAKTFVDQNVIVSIASETSACGANDIYIGSTIQDVVAKYGFITNRNDYFRNYADSINTGYFQGEDGNYRIIRYDSRNGDMNIMFWIDGYDTVRRIVTNKVMG